MLRRHLIELHEQDWCPTLLRHGLRGVLQQISSSLPAYEAVAAELLQAMDASGTTEVLDLCAGAGGPWVRLMREIGDDPRLDRVRLTDIFPDVEAMATMQRRTHDRVEPWPESVDAQDVPEHLPGFRTIFAAFHHFEPVRARRVLTDAVRAGRGIGIFELTERTVLNTAFITLAAAPLTLALLPFLRPFRWAYVPVTYLLPVLPAMMIVDGFVSCLRTYHPDEMLEMAREVGPEYTWKAGRARAPNGPVSVVYLVGVPPV